MEQESIRPGRYRHFKGNEYEVLYLGQYRRMVCKCKPLSR